MWGYTPCTDCESGYKGVPMSELLAMINGIMADDGWFDSIQEFVSGNMHQEDDLSGLDLDNIVSIDFTGGVDSENTQNVEVTVTFDNGIKHTQYVELTQVVMDQINSLLFDESGNSRLFQQEMHVLRVTEDLLEENEALDAQGFEEGETYYFNSPVVLREGQAAVTEDFFVPIRLTPNKNNGGTLETGYTTNADNTIVVGRLDLLHQAYIDAAGGYNTLEIEAKGEFAQPAQLLNIQDIRIHNLPNIYDYDEWFDGSGDGSATIPPFNYGRDGEHLVPDESVAQNSTIDLSRATSIEKLTITESGYESFGDEDYDGGSLTVAGIRNGAELHLESGFSQVVNLFYGQGITSNGLNIVLNNVDFHDDAELNIAHNANTFNIASIGGDNHLNAIASLNDATLSTINVSGHAHLHISGDLAEIYNNVNARLATFDASENTGGVNINFGTGGTGDGKQDRINFTGSQADDVLTVADDADAKIVNVTNAAGANLYGIAAEQQINITDGTGGNTYLLRSEDEGLVINVSAQGEGRNTLTLIEEGDEAEEATITFEGNRNSVTLEEDVKVVNVTMEGARNNLTIEGDTEEVTAVLGDRAVVALEDGEHQEVTVTVGDNSMVYVEEASDFINITSGGNSTFDVISQSITINAEGSNNTAYISGVADSDTAGVNDIDADNGALVNIDMVGTVVLGHPSDDRDDANGLTALEGSTINTTNITVLAESNLRQAELEGIQSIVLADELTLTTSQFLELGAGVFSVMNTPIAEDRFQELTLVVEDNCDLTEMTAQLQMLQDAGIKLNLHVEAGANLTLTAEQLHKFVAEGGITFAESGTSNDVGTVTINNAGPNFDATDEDGGAHEGGSIVISSGDGSNVIVNRTENGFERPVAEDADQIIITVADGETYTSEGIESEESSTLIINGEGTVNFEGSVKLDDDFTIDFSELDGTVTNLTVVDFHEVEEIIGNNSGTRINVELDDDLGDDGDGLVSSGVETYVVTNLNDDNHAFWTCETTQDLEVLGLQGNYGNEITFGNVDHGVNFLMEAVYDKNEGSAVVGQLVGNYAREGATSVVNITNPTESLAAGEWIRVEGITLENAADVTINATGGDTRIESLAVGAADNLTLTTEGTDSLTLQVADDELDELDSLDATGVEGTFTLEIAGETDLSEVNLSGVDRVVFTDDAGDLTLTVEQIQAIGVENFVMADGVNTATLDVALADLIEADVEFSGSADFMALIGVTIIEEDSLFSQETENDDNEDVLTILSTGDSANSITVNDDNEIVVAEAEGNVELENIKHLVIVGDQDLAVDGVIELENEFTVDFSELEGTLTGLTLDNFHNVDEIIGNGAEGTRINVKLESDVASQGLDAGFKTSGVAEYVVIDMNEDNHEIFFCDNSQDLQVVGLSQNAGTTLTLTDLPFGAVNPSILLEGDGAANFDELSKAAGDPNASNIGAVVANWFRDGEATGVFNINNAGTALGARSDGGVRSIHAEGIETNAGIVNVNIADGNTVLANLTAADATAINVSSTDDADVAVWMNAFGEDLTSIDASDVEGQALLGLGTATDVAGEMQFGATDFNGNGLELDISEINITGFDGIVLANELELTISVEQYTTLNFIDASGDDDAAELTVVDLNDQVFSVGTLDGDISVAAVIIEAVPAVELNAATDLSNVGEVIVPQGTTLTLSAEQLVQLVTTGGTIEGPEGGQGGRVIVDGFTQAHLDALGEWAAAKDTAEAFDFADAFAAIGTANGDLRSVTINADSNLVFGEYTDTDGTDYMVEVGDKGIRFDLDGNTLTLEEAAQANGLWVVNGAVVLDFHELDGQEAPNDVAGLDMTRYIDITNVEVYDWLVASHPNLQQLFFNLASSLEDTRSIIDIVEYTGEEAFAGDRIVNVHEGVSTEANQNDGDLIFVNPTAADTSDNVQNVWINLLGDATVSGNIILDRNSQKDGHFRTLTINSLGEDANVIEGFISADGSREASEIDGVADDAHVVENNLLNIVINATEAELSINGAITFQSVAADATARLTLTGEHNVTLRQLDTTDGEVDHLIINTEEFSGTLEITGGSDSLMMEDTESLTFVGGADIVLDTNPEEDGIDGDGDLQVINAAAHTGDLTLGKVKGLDGESFSFTSGTGVTSMTLLDHDIDDNDATWSFDFSEAAAGSFFEIASTTEEWAAGVNTNETLSQLNINLGANTELRISENTDWSNLDLSLSDTQNNPIQLNGATLTLTAAQANGLHIEGTGTVNIVDLGTEEVDLSGIDAGIAGTATLADNIVALHEGTDLGDFSITVGVPNDGQSQVIGFATQDQAHGREVIVAEDNTGNDNAVAWLFDTRDGTVDASNYSSALDRLFIRDDLVNADPEVEQFWTGLHPSIQNINIQYTGDLESTLAGVIETERTFEVAGFAELTSGLDLLKQTDDNQFYKEVTIQLGGSVQMGDLTLNHIIDPTTVDDPDAAEFETLTIQSGSFNVEAVYNELTNIFAPKDWGIHGFIDDNGDRFVLDGDGNPTGDVTNSAGNEVAATGDPRAVDEDGLPLVAPGANTIGNIQSGDDLNLLTVILKTEGFVNVVGSAAQDLNVGKITFDGDATLVDPTDPTSGTVDTATLKLEGAEQIVVGGVDAGGLDFELDVSDFTGTYAITGGSPAIFNTSSIEIAVDGQNDANIYLGYEWDEDANEGTGGWVISEHNGIASDELTSLTVTGAGTSAVNIQLSQVNGDEFTFTAGAGINHVTLDGDMALADDGEWEFNFAAGTAASTLVITDDVTLGDGELTITGNETTNTTVRIEGDVDWSEFEGLTVTRAQDVDLVIAAGSKLTLTQEQVGFFGSVINEEQGEDDTGILEIVPNEGETDISGVEGAYNYNLNPSLADDDLIFNYAAAPAEANLTRIGTDHVVTVALADGDDHEPEGTWSGFQATDVLSVDGHIDLTGINEGVDLGGIGSIYVAEGTVNSITVTAAQHEALKALIEGDGALLGEGTLAITLSEVVDGVTGIEGVSSYFLHSDPESDGNNFTLAPTDQQVKASNQPDVLNANLGRDQFDLADSADNRVVYDDAEQSGTVTGIIDEAEVTTAEGTDAQSQRTIIHFEATDFDTEGDVIRIVIERDTFVDFEFDYTVTDPTDPAGSPADQLEELRDQLNAAFAVPGAYTDITVNQLDTADFFIRLQGDDDNAFEVTTAQLEDDDENVERELDVEDVLEATGPVGGSMTFVITDEQAALVNGLNLASDDDGTETRLDNYDIDFSVIETVEDLYLALIADNSWPLDGPDDSPFVATSFAQAYNETTGELTLQLKEANRDLVVADGYDSVFAELEPLDRIASFQAGDMLDFSAFEFEQGDFVGPITVHGQSANSPAEDFDSLYEVLAFVDGELDLGQFGYFEFDGNTYVYANLEGENTVTSGDLVVQLTGTLNLEFTEATGHLTIDVI